MRGASSEGDAAARAPRRADRWDGERDRLRAWREEDFGEGRVDERAHRRCRRRAETVMLKRELSDWPGGVESVWPLIDAESIRALRAGTPPDNRALRVSSDLEEEELAGSTFVGNAMVLLRAAGAEAEPLRVTSSGTLSLASVARMRAAMTWPDMEATEHFREGKKYRERDLWELHLLRRMVQEAGLIERGARSLELTAPGRSILDAGSRGALQALLFRVFFWHMDLSLFVGWLVRRVPGRWPQNDIGVVLWALAGVAAEWQSADTLAVSCTDPENRVPHGYRGRPAMLFVSRVLVPLCWFGVIEWREMKEMFDVRRWRKTGLFDRLLSFNVRLADRHNRFAAMRAAFDGRYASSSEWMKTVMNRDRLVCTMGFVGGSTRPRATHTLGGTRSKSLPFGYPTASKPTWTRRRTFPPPRDLRRHCDVRATHFTGISSQQ